ncbi:MYXO-CTERM sorting domain-containing protein [Polyangium sorediatum]|uniref:MYXO-CTERM sorting domain-containing protein n=1 Tax=Polyangium sorediatum TaxID=889274 RepID=A0ABT6P431_9BACT|nr:MYXO-CTERM sorting domain-containing protein [Polyangium sorediatum]MDI1435309.1 MYXO-CTERM sorting domain-containing protein [Polyangium sorediatum]
MKLSKLLFSGMALCPALALTTVAAREARAEDRTFPAGSLIIPMDQAYQAEGIYQSYGLLFHLLREGVPVHWVIESDKVWHGAACNTAGDLCAWDCAEEGSGVKCPYPTASPDFFAGAQVVWGNPAKGATIKNHGYRGGPFVVDAPHRDKALEIVNAWNDQSLWGQNPWADRATFQVVTVHEATAPFSADSKKELLAAPTIAVFADGNEDIATAYLRAAGIKQSNGAEFPAAKCGAGTCGPGTANPDLLTVPSVMGNMGTCDAPNQNHKNGALFTPEGLPAYCQIMSMHWNVADRELVQCGGGNCPATPEECAGEPITYHGHEVVAEVRSFLQYPTHFFAECQAVNAYENAVPNPAWPYLDDPGRMGHFLTTTGNPPPCPCNPGPDEGDFQCVVDGCGPGKDCCLPKDIKEKGAGFLIAPSPSPIKVLRPDVPYMQFDGFFAPEGGSEPAYNLSTYLGTTYKNDRDVTFITATDGPGKEDVWMSGYMDGTCDVDPPPPPPKFTGDEAPPKSFNPEESCGGKVSYLGGHSYTGKAGQRLFLNALFEADCTSESGQPRMGLSLTGELVVAAKSLPVERGYVVGYKNEGSGPALDAVLRALHAASGLEVVDAKMGTVSAEGGSWALGAISGTISQPNDPAASGSRDATLKFTQFGEHVLNLDIRYRVGVSTLSSTMNYMIRVLLDTDGDGVPDETDPSPNDPASCGDSDMDECDDCKSGTFDPGNDGCGPAGSGGSGSSGGASSDPAGCGCRIGPASASPALLLAFSLLGLGLGRRTRRRPR